MTADSITAAYADPTVGSTPHLPPQLVDIDPFDRMLLTTDGTVTTLLEACTGEPIVTRTTRQTGPATIDRLHADGGAWWHPDVELLELAPAERLLARRVVLRGARQRRCVRVRRVTRRARPRARCDLRRSPRRRGVARSCARRGPTGDSALHRRDRRGTRRRRVRPHGRRPPHRPDSPHLHDRVRTTNRRRGDRMVGARSPLGDEPVPMRPIWSPTFSIMRTWVTRSPFETESDQMAGEWAGPRRAGWRMMGR